MESTFESSNAILMFSRSRFVLTVIGITENVEQIYSIEHGDGEQIGLCDAEKIWICFRIESMRFPQSETSEWNEVRFQTEKQMLRNKEFVQFPHGKYIPEKTYLFQPSLSSTLDNLYVKFCDELRKISKYSFVNVITGGDLMHHKILQNTRLLS